MAKELDTFLDGEEAGQAEADPPSAAAEPPQQEAVPVAEPKERPSPAPEAEPAKEEDDHPVPDDVAGLRAAVQAERAKRKDYKGERDRLQGEMAAIKAELEAARKAPSPAPTQPQQQPSQPMAIPNPVEDPQGYHEFLERKSFNDRLNFSEALLREQHDDADVDAKMAVFKEAVAKNPALRAELTRQPHPYRWAYREAEKLMALQEIGDPSAYRTKLEAEIRAKVEAEYAGTQQNGSNGTHRVQLPQSLTTARSAGPRSSPMINVAESFDDILRTARK